MSKQFIVRVNGDPTPFEVEQITNNLRSLLVKMWLIAEHRLDDLAEYDREMDVRFEQEAEAAGFSVELVRRDM